MTAGIYAVSAQAYAAALNGNSEAFVLSDSIPGIDLDKAWHAIHYLLTGDTTLTLLLSGTQIVGVSEHSEVHAPENIAALHHRLSSILAAEIVQKFDPTEFNRLGIYPEGWTVPGASYIEQHLRVFIAMLERAADSGHGLFIVIH